MEGTLKPDYHYIEVKPDFSDLEEKMDYYTAHPDEAQAIINHAHEYVEQFKDKQREDIISLMVLDKYFSLLKSKDQCLERILSIMKEQSCRLFDGQNDDR